MSSYEVSVNVVSLSWGWKLQINGLSSKFVLCPLMKHQNIICDEIRCLCVRQPSMVPHLALPK